MIIYCVKYFGALLGQCGHFVGNSYEFVEEISFCETFQARNNRYHVVLGQVSFKFQFHFLFFQMKIRHDNSILGSAWFLDRVEVRTSDGRIIFPCQRWLATGEDDGQIERTLVPVDEVVLISNSHIK